MTVFTSLPINKKDTPLWMDNPKLGAFYFCQLLSLYLLIWFLNIRKSKKVIYACLMKLSQFD